MVQGPHLTVRAIFLMTKKILKIRIRLRLKTNTPAIDQPLGRCGAAFALLPFEPNAVFQLH